MDIPLSLLVRSSHRTPAGLMTILWSVFFLYLYATRTMVTFLHRDPALLVCFVAFFFCFFGWRYDLGLFTSLSFSNFAFFSSLPFPSTLLPFLLQFCVSNQSITTHPFTLSPSLPSPPLPSSLSPWLMPHPYTFINSYITSSSWHPLPVYTSHLNASDLHPPHPLLHFHPWVPFTSPSTFPFNDRSFLPLISTSLRYLASTPSHLDTFNPCQFLAPHNPLPRSVDWASHSSSLRGVGPSLPLINSLLYLHSPLLFFSCPLVQLYHYYLFHFTA